VNLEGFWGKGKKVGAKNNEVLFSVPSIENGLFFKTSDTFFLKV
jgi:hypothetical protein